MFCKAMMRAQFKLSIKKLNDELFSPLFSKVVSLIALKRVYRNWLSVLKVYYLGGKASIILNDNKGNTRLLLTDKKNVTSVVQLAIALSKLRGEYELNGDKIHFFNLSTILSGGAPFSDFRAFSLLLSQGAGIIQIDEDHYSVSIDDLVWTVRQCSSDIYFAVLLKKQEPPQYRWFLKALNTGAVFLDVGAYLGGYTVRACKLGAEVIALEPNRENYSLLLKNLELNHCSRIHAFNLAAGAKEEMKPLLSSDSGLPVLYSLFKGNSSGEYVKVVSLDSTVLPLISDRRIQLIKIDVEGAELEVLKGGINTLNRADYLMIEVWSHSERQLIDFLKQQGFKLIDAVRKSNSDTAYDGFFKRTMDSV